MKTICVNKVLPETDQTQIFVNKKSSQFPSKRQNLVLLQPTSGQSCRYAPSAYDDDDDGDDDINDNNDDCGDGETNCFPENQETAKKVMACERKPATDFPSKAPN